MHYHSSENQSILGRLVEREVLCNISYLMGEINQLVRSGGQSDDITDELMMEAFEVTGPDQYKERAEEECYAVVEYDGEYSWYEEDEFKGKVPFKDIHEDHEAFKVNGVWCVFDKGDYDPEEDEDDVDFAVARSQEKEEAIKEAWNSLWDNDWFDTEEEAWRDCCDRNDIYPDPVEVYEHWIVTSWFAYKLRSHGERVITLGTNEVWCRTCTGQAILLDHVIGEIAEGMEILERQRNSWSEKKEESECCIS